MLKQAWITGCIFRYNENLEATGSPYSIECELEGPMYKWSEAVRLAGEAIDEYIAELIENPVLDARPRWEFVAGSYNLYKMKIYCEGRVVGELRVVEASDTPLVLAGVIEKDPPCRTSLLEQLKKKKKIERGHVFSQNIFPDSNPGRTGPAMRQVYIKKPVTYDVLGEKQDMATKYFSEWSIRVEGQRRLNLPIKEIEPTIFLESDFHCVTGWSLKNQSWSGVPLISLFERAGIPSHASWVIFESLKGYSTIIPLKEALDNKVLLALTMNKQPLSIDRGGPARIISPNHYGWKQIKWLTKIKITEHYRDGYWEARGYHERGNAFLEERFKIRNTHANIYVLTHKSKPKPPK